MRYDPGLTDDVTNVSLIAGSAAVAVLLSIGAIVADGVATSSGVTVVRDVRPVARPEPVEIDRTKAEPLTGINRLYGTVTTTDGSAFTGYLRWDRNEGSWTDLLDAVKPRGPGGATLSGIRFGHIDRLDVTSHDAARLTLRTGDRVELRGHASDIGDGLRALIVDDGKGARTELAWDDLRSVDFHAPGDVPPLEARLFGTVTTRSGLDFTGYVAWDVDEIYSTDLLDGERDGARAQIPFGDIASIERYSSWAAKVTLVDGDELLLEGTNDVDASMGGVEVSDLTLGSVKLDWEEFDKVRFYPGDDDVAAAGLDGGSLLRGTVITTDGRELTGEVTWDADERFSWEMLNGEVDGVDMHVELAHIARIEKTSRGARVTLHDGRSFALSGSNDVGRGNRGIFVRTDEGEFRLGWDVFSELRLTR